MAAQVFTYLALLLYFTGAKAWKCAKYEHYFSQQPDYIDCFWDCCGNSFNRHCCAPIGIIVGCCIVGATVVAGIVVVMSCWWSRRRARHTKGPRLFHNRRHSHYPTAPSSVTRPAPSYSGPPDQKGPGYGPPQGGYGPPPDRGYGPPAGRYGPPPDRNYGPPPDRNYGPPSDRNNEKPPIDDFYNERPPAERGYGPPPGRDQSPRGAPVHRGPPSNRGPPSRSDFSSADEYSDFEQRGRGPPPRNGNQGRIPPPQGRAPPPSRPVQPQPKAFIDL